MNSEIHLFKIKSATKKTQNYKPNGKYPERVECLKN